MADKSIRGTPPHDQQLNETSTTRPRVGNGNIDVGRRNFYFMSVIAIPQHEGLSSLHSGNFLKKCCPATAYLHISKYVLSLIHNFS